MAVKNFRLEIDADIKDHVDQIVSDRGMSLRSFTERAFWFVLRMPKPAQAMILGHVDVTPELIRQSLEAFQAIRSSPEPERQEAEEDEPRPKHVSSLAKPGRAVRGESRQRLPNRSR